MNVPTTWVIAKLPLHCRYTAVTLPLHCRYTVVTTARYTGQLTWHSRRALGLQGLFFSSFSPFFLINKHWLTSHSGRARSLLFYFLLFLFNKQTRTCHSRRALGLQVPFSPAWEKPDPWYLRISEAAVPRAHKRTSSSGPRLLILLFDSRHARTTCDSSAYPRQSRTRMLGSKHPCAQWYPCTQVPSQLKLSVIIWLDHACACGWTTTTTQAHTRLCKGGESKGRKTRRGTAL
jgi:hypothetical protein